VTCALVLHESVIIRISSVARIFATVALFSNVLAVEVTGYVANPASVRSMVPIVEEDAISAKPGL
jgi:hypothetical protein